MQNETVEFKNADIMSAGESAREAMRIVKYQHNKIREIAEKSRREVREFYKNYKGYS